MMNIIIIIIIIIIRAALSIRTCSLTVPGRVKKRCPSSIGAFYLHGWHLNGEKSLDSSVFAGCPSFFTECSSVFAWCPSVFTEISRQFIIIKVPTIQVKHPYESCFDAQDPSPVPEDVEIPALSSICNGVAWYDEGISSTVWIPFYGSPFEGQWKTTHDISREPMDRTLWWDKQPSSQGPPASGASRRELHLDQKDSSESRHIPRVHWNETDQQKLLQRRRSMGR